MGKNLPAMREMQDTQVRSLGQEDPVQEEPRVPPGARPPVCGPAPQRNIPELREVRQHPRSTQHTSLSHTSPLCWPGHQTSALRLPSWGRDEGHRAKMLGRRGNGSRLQYSCLENLIGRGAWWAIMHGIAKSWIRLSTRMHTRTHTHTHTVLTWIMTGQAETGTLPC